MKKSLTLLFLSWFFLFPRLLPATQADDTTITIDAQTAGPTPFISQLMLTASDTSVIKSIRFTVAPKTGSVIRPLSATYGRDYLLERGYIIPPSQQIFFPVYGLYDGFTNSVTVTYFFLDGSSKDDSTTITTAAFDDQGCGYKNPIVLQARSASRALSYDYFLIRSGCGDYSPVILDTDGALRWVSPFGLPNSLTASSGFLDNAVYAGKDTTLYRIDLDGTVTALADYSSLGVTSFHHNLDRGKVGLVADVDTTEQFESVNLEFDAAGNVVQQWDLGAIISEAMVAGGDDPSQFVYPSPTDWFHNNAATYNRADDSLLVSSRENFVISLDYDTGEIKWIFGDMTKKWFQFPSLAQLALTLGPDTTAPIGQHAISIAHDQNLLLFDNGFESFLQQPPGLHRSFSSARKYYIDEVSGTASEVWNFEKDQSIVSPFCSSVYEDAPFNYLIDYAFAGGLGATDLMGQVLGLDSSGNTVFYYSYPTEVCNTAYNSVPLHLESSIFPAVERQTLNVSTRGLIGAGDDALIAGFIVNGSGNKTVALRALGPSLAAAGVSGVLANPKLTLFDSTGQEVAANDDWATDIDSERLTANGLAPHDPLEAALVVDLAQGAYTAVVTGSNATPGIGLVEAYDLSPLSGSALVNISTRGTIGTGDAVLIAGFVIGDAANATVIIRALGPSLERAGVNDPLGDPQLSVYDSNGVLLRSNNNWEEDPYFSDITQNGLAPADPAEAATILHLPAGAYTSIVTGVNGTSGTGLVETYNLESTTISGGSSRTTQR